MSNNHKTFELKIEHLALLRGLVIGVKTISLIGCVDSKLTPFGGNSLEDDLAILLVGKELTDKEKEKLDSEGKEYYTRDNMEPLKQIYSELPQALQIVLSAQTFEPGVYRTRWYECNWKLMD